MIHTRHVALGLLLASSLIGNGAASAQASGQQCIRQLSAPTHDSLTLRVMFTVSAVDRQHPLPAILQMDVAEAITKYLRLPAPLALDVYEVSTDTSVAGAHLALWGNYEATLTAAGRMRGADVVAGARHVAFDAALLAALRSIRRMTCPHHCMAFRTTFAFAYRSSPVQQRDQRHSFSISPGWPPPCRRVREAEQWLPPIPPSSFRSFSFACPCLPCAA